MESNQISVSIPNYSGPLEVLLDLAKSQKVNLAEISITKLADQFLEFIKVNENLNTILKAEKNVSKQELLQNACFYLFCAHFILLGTSSIL